MLKLILKKKSNCNTKVYILLLVLNKFNSTLITKLLTYYQLYFISIRLSCIDQLSISYYLLSYLLFEISKKKKYYVYFASTS